MRENSRLGIWRRNSGLETELIERVVCGPVVVQVDDGPGSHRKAKGLRATFALIVSPAKNGTMKDES